MYRIATKTILLAAAALATACDSSTDPVDHVWTLDISGPSVIQPDIVGNFTASVTRDGAAWPAPGEAGGVKWALGEGATVTQQALQVSIDEVGFVREETADTVPVVVQDSLIRCDIWTTTTFHTAVRWSYGGATITQIGSEAGETSLEAKLVNGDPAVSESVAITYGADLPDPPPVRREVDSGYPSACVSG